MGGNVSSIARLLLALGEAGVEIAVRGDRLLYRPATLTPDLAARLRTHKSAVLELLAAGDGYAPEADSDPEAAYVFNERLGIADDLNMPTHPGSPAWLIAAGESLDHACITESSGVEFGVCQQ